MTWKLYALGSGGAFAVTYLVSLVQPFDLVRSEPAPQAAVAAPAALVDLSATADRLRVRIGEAVTHKAPARNAFKFGAARRPSVASPAAVTEAPPPAVVAPPRPPYAMAGVATTVEGGVTSRTAVLTSLTGVTLVKAGDLLDGLYRVVSVTDDSVEIESTRDGVRTVLRLPESP